MYAFAFDNTYARELPGSFVAWPPAPVPAPRLLFLNRALAEELGLDADALEAGDAASLFAGNRLPEGAQPIAQAYAGHQFGGFSPQLGDGRALLLGEVVDRAGRRRDIAFKGSGRTPFSRGGDGKAAVGPMLREVLLGEAMHALGIPTTRALAVAATGEPVLREQPLPGAVLTRVASSHLRVGTFQYFAARGEVDRLRPLAEYTIARHDPALAGAPGRVVGLLRAVAQRQAALVAKWMNVGFIHGVMNTDNMTISGETIDYGPCAFLEAYDPQTVFSSIDHHGRYAYGNQPAIARWNLARLAEALLPLLADGDDEAAVRQAVDQVTEVIDAFPGWYHAAWRAGQRAKLGLAGEPPGTVIGGAGAADIADQAIPGRGEADPAQATETHRAPPFAATDAAGAEDAALADDWLALLQSGRVDFTLAWRRLADAAAGDEAPLRALFAVPQTPEAAPQVLDDWLVRWRARCAGQDRAAGSDGPAAAAARAARMRQVNPWVIPRNHRVEEALAAASTEGDLGPFEGLLDALRYPFDEDPARARYAEPAPAALTACYRTFCGT